MNNSETGMPRKASVRMSRIACQIAPGTTNFSAVRGYVRDTWNGMRDAAMSFAKFAASEMQTFPGMHAEQVMPARAAGISTAQWSCGSDSTAGNNQALYMVTLKAT